MHTGIAELLYVRVWWVVSGREWLARWRSLSPVSWTLRLEQPAPFVTRARVTFTVDRCVSAGRGAATDMEAC